MGLCVSFTVINSTEKNVFTKTKLGYLEFPYIKIKITKNIRQCYGNKI